MVMTENVKSSYALAPLQVQEWIATDYGCMPTMYGDIINNVSDN